MKINSVHFYSTALMCDSKVDPLKVIFSNSNTGNSESERLLDFPIS